MDKVVNDFEDFNDYSREIFEGVPAEEAGDRAALPRSPVRGTSVDKAIVFRFTEPNDLINLP